ncbi:MAG: cache domain-containing protein [Desulfobacterales bacterium]|nr:cache domain-containing protein [Desulfobacterales bacterium]
MITTRFPNVKLKTKVCAMFLLLFMGLTLPGSALFYFHIKETLQMDIEAEMEKTTAFLADVITTSAAVSVKNTLETISAQHLEITARLYDLYLTGVISRDTALEIIKAHYTNQTIGENGYIACQDGTGNIIVHPDPGVIGKNIKEFASLNQLTELQSGYLEYSWQNPGDTEARPKALQRVYFEPLDWYILVSAYRDEFTQLTDINDFKAVILSAEIKETGYAFIFDETGHAVVHPGLAGGSLLTRARMAEEIHRMIRLKNGTIRTKGYVDDDINMVIKFRHIPDYNWIVATTVPMAEIFSPMDKFKQIILAWIFTAIVVSLLSAYQLSRVITAPIERLVAKLQSGYETDLSIRMNHTTSDEVGLLSMHFDAYMEKIQKNHSVLLKQAEKTAEARKQLAKSEMKFRGLFNQSFHFIGILSPDGRLREVNQSALDFIASSCRQIIDTHFWNLPCWEFNEETTTRVKHLIATSAKGETTRFEAENTGSEGKKGVMDISVKPVKDANNCISFLLVEGRDVTKMKQAEDQRRGLAIQLEKAQKMEALGTLSGGIAHDFNNILLGIFGYCELAKSDLEDREKLTKYISRIHSGAKRAADLVRQILTYTRKPDALKRAVAPYGIVTDAVKLVRASVPKRIEVLTDIRSERLVNGDPAQLHQVVMNLLTNAYQAIGSNNGTLTVCIYDLLSAPPREEPDIFPYSGSYLVIKVSDTGCGMDKQLMDKIFDPYFSTKRPGKGTGLGLAVVKGIVEAHKGFINVSSEPDNGSSFKVYLPIVGDSQSNECDERQTLCAKGSGERIMIVDDEEDIRFATGEWLKHHGYRVMDFEHPITAWDTFKEDPHGFDLILTDMSMPVMNGFDFACKVMALRRDIPVLLFTGYSDDITREEAVSRGIREYIRKPVGSLELMGFIRDALDQK